jgi:hypothetical protein
MILAFFVSHRFQIGVASGQTAVGKGFIRFFTRDSKDDERSGLRGWIAAQPFGVGGANGFWKAIGWTEDLDGSVFAVVAGGDAKMRLLVRR